MRVLRWAQVRARVQLSRSTITRLEHRGAFPRRVRLSGNSVGWIDAEIETWLRERIAETVPAAQSPEGGR